MGPELEKQKQGAAAFAEPQEESDLTRIARLLEETAKSLDTSTLRDARAQFSGLVERVVESRRPQRITRRGEEAVIVVNETDFWALVRRVPQEIPMAHYFRAIAPDDDATPLAPLARTPARDIAKL
jgi:prevent-host-death family protein